MRYNGTKYPKVDNIPPNSMPVSQYAKENNIAAAYVYVKYERFLNGKGQDPGYTIKCFLGSNFVIPN